MTAKLQAIPTGFEHATPYLCCKGAAQAIEFYKQAFGAEETMRLGEPDGRIGHAGLRLNGAPIMLSDEYPDMGVVSPTTLGGSPVTIHIYVEDVDALFTRAVAAGAKATRPPADQFYGDRSGSLEDPFGHKWMFATHIEDVDAVELQKRYDAMMAK